MTTYATLPRDTDGQLSKWAWPGGYPLFYLDSENAVICADCARKWQEYSTKITAADVNWEDANLRCENCEQRIESAYAD